MTPKSSWSTCSIHWFSGLLVIVVLITVYFTIINVFATLFGSNCTHMGTFATNNSLISIIIILLGAGGALMSWDTPIFP